MVAVDLHTGRGEFGDATILLDVPEDSSSFRRALSIWATGAGADTVESTVTGESVSVYLEASLKAAFPSFIPDAEVTAVSLEFGAFETLPTFKALRLERL